ncbi:MAG: TIGR03621 family F420-dependent LLM class oxidoreductase [Oscillochloris sp.]|nr:TIGR03621 family F420-dependent LLM class oxidoreductase [Oscillochloris sp.]
MQRAFRFGIINEQMADRNTWFDLVRRSEAAGFSTFLLRDHLIADVFGDQHGPIAAMAMAAAITTTLRVGSMVLANDYRHPAILAKEAATIDRLSGGRLELGLGAGWLRAEYEQAGMVFDAAATRISRLAEAIQVLRGVWAAEPFSFAGEHYRIQALDGTPKPVQQPGPPILIGGGKRNMLTLAGRYADSVGILTTSVASGNVSDTPDERMPAAVRQKVAWVRAGAGDRFDQIELSLIPTLVLTDRRREASEELIRRRGWVGVTVEDVWAMPSVLIGNAAQIRADLLERRASYGFSYYIFSDRQIDQAEGLVGAL